MINRRGFLKAVAAIGAMSAIQVPAFSLIVPSQELLPDQKWIATARELCAYSITDDSFIFRTDLLCGNKQFGVDFRLTNSISKEAFQDYRQQAAELLRDAMKKEGLKLADLRPLALPPGYIEPDWLKEMSK